MARLPVPRFNVPRWYLEGSAVFMETWMGGAIDCFDNLCDRAPGGEVEVAGGVLRYEHDCNWKFFLENLNDTMHPMVTHQSVVQAAQEYIAKYIGTFKEFPPSQKVGSFSLDQVLDRLTAATTSGK